MQLRSRITITFVALLAAVFAATLAIVSIANRQNAGREISREFTVGASVLERVLDSNQRQLKQAADVLAQDFGFRTAVASADTDTIRSVLENHGERIGADVVVLSDTGGRTLAAAGPEDAGLPGLQFVDSARGAGSETARLALRGQRVYQVVEVVIRAPLPIARVVMGFELDAHMLAEVSGILGVDVTLLVSDGRRWQVAGSTLGAAAASTVRDALATRQGASPELAAGDLALRASELTRMRAGQPAVVAVLSRSRSLLQAQFDRLTRVLWIATLLGLAATALSGWWLARGITRPLSRLTAAVDRIRRGEYDADVAAERDDEVGVLARGLGEMRTQVVDRDASIRRLAFEDPLTGLRNRTGFVAAVEQRLAAGGVAAIAVIDLRRFRIINECLGFAVGDQVLRHVGERLQAAASEPAQVARLAADQFALMADAGVGDVAAAAAWAQSLLARLSRPVQIEAQSIDIAPVVGLAIGPQDATEAAALLRCADMALDHARRRSLGVAAFGPEIPVPGRDQLSLLGELQRAVREDELRLAVQPKIDLRSGAVRGAEVLLRWQHPQRGWISPGEFIPFAERTGFVRHLTEWALAKSARLARQLDDAGLPVTLSVNISAVDLAHPQLDDQVRAAIAAAGVPPQRLTLEVTESGFIDNPREALAMLEALRSIGVRLSIDDFGTGYSSLSYLAHMPVDELKVDQSFVRGLEQDAALVAVVGAATEMGHRLGLSVVAEGVETEAQARILRELGCDVAQGYLYARPMPPEQLRDWLSGRTLWQPQAAGSIGAADAAARSAERA